MDRKNYKILTVLFLWIEFAACVRDAPPAALNSGLPGGSGNVYVVCEGAYGNGNASLYDWQPAKDSVFGDIFRNANAGMMLGDVFQSMVRIGSSLFLCVNNSNMVRVIDAHSYVSQGVIAVQQPRYILDMGNGTAWVTSLYHNRIYRISTSTLSVLDTLVIPAKSAEGMCLLHGLVYVTCWDTSCNKLVVMDAGTGAIRNTIRIAGYAPQAVLADKEEMLWVLSGNADEGRRATLTRIDPSTGVILDSFLFPVTVNPVRPVFNGAKDTLYFIDADYSGSATNNGIFRMGIHNQTLPAVPFLRAGIYSYFWALGIDPNSGYIYAGDPRGFAQAGVVYIVRQDGTKTDSFKVGIGPGHFYFDE
jgi:hypothetical protein